MLSEYPNPPDFGSATDFCDNLNCYHPQRSWSKVMFLHVSVILFTGRGVSRPTPRERLGGSGGGGIQATPRGEVEGSDWWSLQACTWGDLQAPPGGDLQAHTQWGCLQAHTQGVVQAQAGVVSQHALRQTIPSQETATGVGGTQPTGMHSCYLLLLTRFMDALTSLTLESNFAKN